MKVPDAIIVLAGGIKQDVSGRWVSTDLTAEDNKLGAPGGKLRVLAAAVLSNKYPSAWIIASGGKGFDVSKDTPEERPLLCKILKREFLEAGIPEERIKLEGVSNTTYQQLQELEKLISENWQNVILIVNRYSLVRLRAMIETKFPALVDIAKSVSAEEVLIEADPVHWETMLAETYKNAFMAERIAKEKAGVEQIRAGTYRLK